MASIYNSRLYKRLATGVVQWRAFDHNKKADNDVQETFTIGVLQWHAFAKVDYTIGLLQV